MMMYVPRWCMHWGCTDGMLSHKKVWRLFFLREMCYLGLHPKGWGLQIEKFIKLARHRATISNTYVERCGFWGGVTNTQSF